MVTSVTAVSGIGKTRRDKRQTSYSASKKKDSEKRFSGILDDRMTEGQKNVMDYGTAVYGRDGRMQNFRSRAGNYYY